MPHAALWVVQHYLVFDIATQVGFNAARGFVGGAAYDNIDNNATQHAFQCRTRLCGWCSFVARSPCPPRGKKPFWKVSENLSVLTENM